MSFSRGGAQELLSIGLAAAQSGNPNDLAEAEYYLEWVLRSDSDSEQQIQAWLWLSRITDDRDKKRDYLESLLALKPSHPEGRRDLAILDGKLKPEQMRADPTASAAGVAMGEQVDPALVQRFPCPKCGAKITFDPRAGVARCQFCGTTADGQGNTASDPQQSPITSEEVSEQDWIAAIHTDQGHTWAVPKESVLQCASCGARLTLSPAVVSGRCAYCGSPQLVQVAAASMGALREPDGVIPFAMGKSGVMEWMQWWLGEQSRRIGVPADLRDKATLQSGVPVYLPFWSFDIAGNVDWSGYVNAQMEIKGVQLGTADLAKAWMLGGVLGGLLVGSMSMTAQSAAELAAKQYENSNKTYATGTATVLMNDTLVAASKSLPDDQLEKMTFDTKRAMPYREDLLASWPAEVYSVSLADASLVARQRAMKKVDDDIEVQTGGTSAQYLRVDRTGLSVLSYKLLLAPVWVVMYNYEGRPYRALVNGLGGNVEGDVPRTDTPIGKLFVR
jgi:predicted RNA-binding Zn-ribbon protein involved in translation (DUF1610 family)